MKEIIQQLFKFSKVYYRKKNWKTCWGYCGSTYPVKEVENIHLESFSYWKMKDLIKPTIITGYDILNRVPVVFTNKCITKKYCDYFVKDVVRGSGAAPAWINPAEFRDGTSKNLIVNANIIANNPTMMAYIEVGKTPEIIDKFKRISPENVLILSIGTGQAQLPQYSFDKVKRWNKSKWFTLITSMAIQSSTIIPHVNLKNLFKSYDAEENYIRIDPEIIFGSHNIMNTSDENMRNLVQDAKNYIAQNHDFLDNIALTLFNQDERYSTMLF